MSRRPVRSDLPPSLILWRDHFGSIVAVALFVATVLYFFFAAVLVGVFGGRRIDRTSRTHPPSGGFVAGSSLAPDAREGAV